VAIDKRVSYRFGSRGYQGGRNTGVSRGGGRGAAMGTGGKQKGGTFSQGTPGGSGGPTSGGGTTTTTTTPTPTPTQHPVIKNRGIPQTNKFKKWISSKFKKPMIEYFYPDEHGDMYTALQTGTMPTHNYHKDVTADYWKNVSKNWSDVHPALGAMVNVGAPAGTMIGGPMYDWYQSGKRYEEDPNKYLSSFQRDVKATQFEPEVKAALETRGVTDISGVDTMGRFKAFAAEQPIKSNLQRMAGSVEPFLNTWGIGNNLNYANGGLINFYRYGGLLSLWPR
jgi:hypothetical protein